MSRALLRVGAVFAKSAVAAGAFGAHGLAPRLTMRAMSVYEVAVRYQMNHAIAMALVAVVIER